MLNRLIKEFNVSVNWEVDGVYMLKNKELYIQFIKPHSGTKFKYLLRADFPETFDRWSVSLLQEEFEEFELDSVIKKLSEFINKKEELVEEALEL